MASFIDFRNPPGSDRRADSAVRATAEPRWVRTLLIGTVLGFFVLFLFLPLIVVFQGALTKGAGILVEAFTDHDILHSVRMTLLVALIAVPANTVFGIAAAWAVTRYRFTGRGILLALIDLPLWVSPVIGGLIYVLLYGRRGYFGPWLSAHEIKIIFALPGMVMATTFVTFPFVARSLIPLMQAQGVEEEEAALTLGAGGFQILRRITLPKIRWGLFYGVILCNARAMGEFGAVSVVSAKISGRTNTMPLEIERLYNDYLFPQAFAVAAALALLALLTLVLKTLSEWENARQLEASRRVTLATTIEPSSAS
jgi:sulfate/thiosulfate transport system permease protein